MESLNPLKNISPPDRMHSLFESLTSAQPEGQAEEPKDYIVIKGIKNDRDRIEAMEAYKKTDEYKNYLDKKWKRQLHNRDAILNLCEYRDTQMRPEEAHAVENKLRQFLKVIGNQQDVYPALKIDLKKLNLLGLCVQSHAVARQIEW